MKRIVFLIVCLIMMAGTSQAQNANRKGFFIEAGFGGLVGNSIRHSEKVAGGVLQYKCLSGPMVEFDFGGRFRTSRHWAYEFLLGAQTTLSDPAYGLCFRILPIGFRYTSNEIWRNISLYTHFNTGTTVSLNNGHISDKSSPLITSGSTFENIDNDSDTGVGIGYSLGVGANITPHFYAELCYDAQAMMNGIGKHGKGTVNGGLLGVKVGYRF